MKRTFTSSFLGLAISGLLLASCSRMASYENEDLALEQARADKGGFTLSPFTSTNGNENAFLDYYEGACTSECIDPENPETFYVLSDRVQFGSANFFIDYSIHHDATTIYYTFTAGATNSANTQISTFNGTTINAPSYSINFPLEEGWQGCDNISRSFTLTRAGQGQGVGSSITINTSYDLIPICTGDEEEECEEVFSWDRQGGDKANLDDTIIIFEYTPYRSKIGAEIQITTPQITAWEAMDGNTYNTFGNQAQGNGGLRWNGDLVCGEKITFIIKFTPINCNNSNNLPANLASNFVVKDMGGNKLTGEPITGNCIPEE